MAHAFPGNWFWKFLSYNQTHVEWAGCSLHDMIQPSFSFLVGVALPYSIASRLAQRARAFGKLLRHAMWRALLLIALGIFLRSMHQPQTYFTFEDTLTQIGLGYTFLFLLGVSKGALAMDRAWRDSCRLLAGLGSLSRAGPGIRLRRRSAFHRIGTHHYTGFAAHWNKNATSGNAFDQWFLNLFPRDHAVSSTTRADT